MQGFPKEVTVRNTDPRLWNDGMVEISIKAIVPNENLPDILNRLGEVL